MAPHNSTLIHEHHVQLTTELKCFSPILPLRKSCASSDHSSESFVDPMQMDEDEIPVWICGEPRYISGIKPFTTCNDIIEALINDEIKNRKYNDVAVLRDVNDYVIIEKWRDVEQALIGDTQIVSIWNAWGAAKNEVQFRLKINKNSENSKNVSTKSKKNKKAKGMISRLVKRVMKQGEMIQQHLNMMSEKTSERKQKVKYQKYIKHKYCKALVYENLAGKNETIINEINACKCCGNKTNNQLCSKINNVSFKSKSILKSSEELFHNNKNELYRSTDEIMLILDHSSNSINVDETKSTISIRETIEHNNSFNLNLEKFNFDDSMLQTPHQTHTDFYRNDLKLHKSSEINELFLKCTPNVDYKDKDEKILQPITTTHNMVPDFRRTSFRFERVRKEISHKMTEMEQLLQHEINLLQKLKIDTSNYKTEQKLKYFKSNTASEIERTEQELIRTKSQLMKKSHSLETLKQLINDDSSFIIQRSKSYEHSFDDVNKENALITDNVSEFFDNNESILL